MTQEHLTRAGVSDLDQILGEIFPVLDHGYVRVVDCMSGNAAIAQAARVSNDVGNKQFHEDAGLVRYLLLRNAHTTPFEACKIKLHLPMDCWR